MAPNRKKLMLPKTMARAGWDLLATRDDIEAVPYPIDIANADLHPLLRDVHGIALAATPFSDPELAAAPHLQVVARIGVGFDAVDIPALTRRRVPLLTAGTANSATVAETALFFMLALARRGVTMDRLVRQGQWWEKFKHLPVDLFEKTVLVVGFGRIGSRIARRCLGMEMTVLVYDPYVPADAIRVAGCEPVADLDAALPRADFLTLHCPKRPETVGLINAARLQRMKPSAFVINTARGGIVDEAALHKALSSGKLAGAGIDVFAQEPVPTDHPLLSLPNVMVAPHIAGGSVESVDRMAIATVRNLLSVLDGAPIRENVINKEVLD